MKKTYRAFSAGELSEDMYGRYDVDKYGTGCMILKNWIIMAQGGVYKRPGTKFRASIGNESKKCRLVPFKFSTIQNYVLEFGDQYMRVYKDGDLVLESDQSIVSASQANPCNIEITGHGYSTGDEVFISGVAGMTELNNRQFKITVVDVDNFTLDGVDSTAYTAYTSGGTAAKVYEITTPYTEDELFELYYAQTADVMTLCHKSHAPMELTRTGHTAWTLTEISFSPATVQPTGAAATNSTGSGSTVYKYKVTAVREEQFEESLPGYESTKTITAITQASPAQVTAASHGYDNGDIVRLKDIVGMTELNDAEYVITVVDANNFTLDDVDSTAYTAYTSGGTSERNTVDCTNDLSTAGNENTISWSAVSGTVKYNIYKSKSGVYGYIGSSETTSFIDDNIDPDVSDTPPRANNPFVGTDNYPGVVGFSQQRRVFASTNNKPDTIWMSKAGLYSNMSKSIPNKDDDSIEFAIASGEVNAINHILGFRDLLTMTDAEEWKVYGNGVLSPTTVAADPETNYGSDIVRPIKIGNTALFAALFGTEVRDYSYTFEADGYDGNDISVLSSHLLRDAYIVDWAFAPVPDKVLWAVLSDGTLCSLTYMKEHRVWGWARHDVGGLVESVAVIPNKTERRHVPHFLVRRTINGQERRYVETLEKYVDAPMEDAYFVDCGLVYDGADTDTISGLWHLEGEEVTVYAEGNVLAKHTVINGMITLTSSYSKYAIGIGTDYEIQPLATESDQGKFGATKGDPKQIKTIDIEVVRTRGLFFGQGPEAVEDDTLNEMTPKFEDGDLSNPILGYTGIYEMAVDPHWNNGYVAPYIYDNYPVPAKILTMTPNYATD